MNRYAIVGFGCAGYHAATRLRRLAPEADIHIYESAARGAANPILTTYYAGAKIDFEQMFPFGNMADICRQFALKHIAEPVERVDAAACRVVTQDGQAERYDKILIATGASALVPAAFKTEGREVFVMRTVQDAQRLRSYLDGHAVRSAAVIGASMVGIKVAELLHNRGIETWLLGSSERIFPTAAYPSTSEKIVAALQAQGLRFRLGQRVKGADSQGVVFSDGSVLPTDLVCLCLGTEANIRLVANTQAVQGQNIEIRRGIVINTHMETSVPNIYAAGDCCEGIDLQTGEHKIIGLWANAAAQGDCAAANMAGIPEEHYGSFPHNITRFFGMTFAGLGDPTLSGQRRSFQGDGVEVGATLADDGTIVSMNILGDCAISGILKSLLVKQLGHIRSGLSATQTALMAKAGLPKEFITFMGGDSP